MNATSPTFADLDIGRRIRLCRYTFGVSLEGLATALGISMQLVQKYEDGTKPTPASHLAEIARFLRVDITFFYDEIINGRAAYEAAHV